MSKLLRVTLEGVDCRRRIVAAFERQACGDWLLTMSINGALQPTLTIPRKEGVKPCWTVACNYLRIAARREAMERTAKPSRRQRKVAKPIGLFRE